MSGNGAEEVVFLIRLRTDSIVRCCSGTSGQFFCFEIIALLSQLLALTL